jgi:hypothetical protein
MNDNAEPANPTTILHAQDGTDRTNQSASGPHAEEPDHNAALDMTASGLDSSHKENEEVPRNSEGKLICVFQNQCPDLSFDRKREWRWDYFYVCSCTSWLLAN